MVSSKDVEWLEQLPCAVTVCDKKFRILYLNERSAEVNARDGGKGLIGKDLLNCHPPEARTKLRRVMAGKLPNIYTIEKNGVKKMVYQAHWGRKGAPAGLLEISFEIPQELPHFVRT